MESSHLGTLLGKTANAHDAADDATDDRAAAADKDDDQNDDAGGHASSDFSVSKVNALFIWWAPIAKAVLDANVTGLSVAPLAFNVVIALSHLVFCLILKIDYNLSRVQSD